MSESKYPSEYVGLREDGLSDSGKTKICTVFPISEPIMSLGTIKWYAPWRQYCFFPNEKSLYNQECLRDISYFTQGLNLEHKYELAKKKGETE